jgi:hypothetical protein
MNEVLFVANVINDVRGHLMIMVRSTTVLPVKYLSYGLRLETEMKRKKGSVNKFDSIVKCNKFKKLVTMEHFASQKLELNFATYVSRSGL